MEDIFLTKVAVLIGCSKYNVLRKAGMLIANGISRLGMETDIIDCNEYLIEEELRAKINRYNIVISM